MAARCKELTNPDGSALLHAECAAVFRSAVPLNDRRTRADGTNRDTVFLATLAANLGDGAVHKGDYVLLGGDVTWPSDRLARYQSKT